MFLEVQRRRLAAAAVSGRRAGVAGTAPDTGTAVAASAATVSMNDSTGIAATSAADTAAASSAAPEVHPSALQPALSARRSFGQGLWWPGDSSSPGSGATLDAAGEHC